MIEITLSGISLFDEQKNEFIDLPPRTIKFEHSLYAIREWEGRWKKPFIRTSEYEAEELLDYFTCMALPEKVDTNEFSYENIKTLKEYIEDIRTATVVKDTSSASGRGRILTAEVMYTTMFEANIPIECERWNFNNLLKVIEIMATKASPKKMSTRDIYKENERINQARKNKYKTRG